MPDLLGYWMIFWVATMAVEITMDTGLAKYIPGFKDKLLWFVVGFITWPLSAFVMIGRAMMDPEDVKRMDKDVEDEMREYDEYEDQ